jgi:hypothetical protein
MTKLEKLLEGIQGLRTPENEKTIKKLTEGITLIADEYRSRKAKEAKARLEAEGFKKLDEQRAESGLDNKAFLESVGKTIIGSSHPEEVKARMMESLEHYAKYLTESVAGCIYTLKPIDARDKDFIVKNDVGGLLHDCILPKSSHKYGDAATAKKMGVDKVAADNGTDIQGAHYTLARKLIDSDHEKLYVLLADDNRGAFLMHYADTPKAASVESTETESNPLTESADTDGGCLYAFMPVDEKAKACLANNDVAGLKKSCIIPHVKRESGVAGAAMWKCFEATASDNGVTSQGNHYTLTSKLIDEPGEKLYILQADNVNLALLMYIADAT